MDFGRYFASTEKKNWHEASRICRSYSMQLAGLESKDEILAVGEKVFGGSIRLIN
jgi:hypothetical protein